VYPFSMNIQNEFSVAPRFRFFIEGSEAAGSAFNYYFYVASDPYFSSITSTSAINASFEWDLTRVAFNLNGKTIVIAPLTSVNPLVFPCDVSGTQPGLPLLVQYYDPQ